MKEQPLVREPCLGGYVIGKEFSKVGDYAVEVVPVVPNGCTLTSHMFVSLCQVQKIDGKLGVARIGKTMIISKKEIDQTTDQDLYDFVIETITQQEEKKNSLN